MIRFLLSAIFLLNTTVLWACPFCGAQGQTLVGEVAVADFIVLGKPANAKPDKDDYTKGTTELIIKSVIKDHPYLQGKTKIIMNRLLPINPSVDERIMVFVSVNGKTNELQAAIGSVTNAVAADAPIDCYRGVEMTSDSKLADYLKGAIAVREKDSVTRLRYFFDYLEVPELEINQDAFMEFGNSDYADVRKLSSMVSTDILLNWLKNPSTSSARFGLYGMMLGHSGKKEIGEFLRNFLEDPKRRYQSGLDGLMAGFILIDQKNGMDYLRAVIQDEKKQEFAIQIAAVKVLRFFWEYRQDIIQKDELIKTMMLSVRNGDFADFAIEDLRKWKQWDLANEIIKICSQETHKKEPMVKRALLIAVSQNAKTPESLKFVDDARKENADRVKEYEDILENERKEQEKQIVNTNLKPQQKK